ncbi:hypothetical protein TrLO_g2347 [Triparma laevis f. longispina]|uniref:Uncharacterized protein n=1 Tax=Triparma laevis f. longispina TaxID=1714387 RepID=A0A9W7FDF3_9STRA|nr:hypothetical protein TrLO_g2347 [Triparma laevis f. longispina]
MRRPRTYKKGDGQNWRKDITQVVIHRDVDEIEGSAFYENNNLTEIDWGNSKVTTIGGNAFYKTGLKKFSCPDTVNVVGRAAVAQRKYLREVECNAKKLAKNAFASNKSLETVILQEGVKTIEQETFARSPKISTFIWADSVEGVGENIFKDSTKLHELAESGDQEKIIEYLKKCVSPLMKLCVNDGKLEDIKKILEENPEAAKVSGQQRNALSYYCRYGSSLEVIKVLVEAHPEGAKNEDAIKARRIQ